MPRRRILVVDDNSAMAAGLARILQRDYDVLVCNDGLAALERVFTDCTFARRSSRRRPSRRVG